jgi:hypothetical protein
VQQYASFGLWSRRMSASEMTTRLGIEPDEISVRAANLVDPPIPASHEWLITCRDQDKTVDEQVQWLVTRLAPYTSEIAELAADLEQDECGGARLRVVRQPLASDFAEEEVTDSGWRLNRQVLRFLHQTNADLSVEHAA